MAILRSMDGKFYNIPDNELEAHLVAPEEVKAKLGDAMKAQPEKSGKEVTPHGRGWRNCWRNCWQRNCWRNYCPN